MEITLSKEQEDAIISSYGSLDFAQVYVEDFANRVIADQAIAVRSEKIKTLSELDAAVLDVLIAAAKEAPAIGG